MVWFRIITELALRLMSGPTITMAGMKMAHLEADLQKPQDEFSEIVLSRGPVHVHEGW